jgi:predicted metal-dependent hydrolase
MAKVNKPKMAVETVTATPQHVIAKRSHEDEARERKWRAEEALRDIERAEGHKRDKGLMKDVKACAKEKMKAYGKL